MSLINRIVFYLLFAALFFSQSEVLSQVTVERSKDKVIISGKPYYIHFVRKGETAYSISKAYYITVDDLVRENPSATTGIREGQSLRIPVVDAPPVKETAEQPLRDETKYIYHKLSAGDTVFSLARRFGVSEEEILQANPGVEINKLSIGTEIAIPRKQFSAASQKLEIQEKQILRHRVEKGESMTSIAEKYGITLRELRRENRGVIFPKVDDYLKIPVSVIAEKIEVPGAEPDSLIKREEETERDERAFKGFTPVNKLNGKINVALLLPLYYSDNAVRIEIDSSRFVKGKRVYRAEKRPDSWIDPDTYPFLEMYLGSLMAADTLRNLGLNLNLHVYDIKQDTAEVISLIHSGILDDVDLIIGPVFSGNLAIVAAYASEREIPVVSPVPLMSNKALEGKSILFIAVPSLEVANEAISKRISDYASGNFVFIHTDTSRTDDEVRSFRQMIFKELSSKIPYEEIRFKEILFKRQSSLSNDSINRLEHALTANSDNIIIIASEDPSVLSETIMDLHALSKKYPVKFVGYPRVRELVNLDTKYFFDMGIEVFSPFWIDYRADDVIKFNRAFRRKFLTEPDENSFAWQGYDITYYFVSGLVMHGKRFIRKPEIHNPDLLETEFDFRREEDNDGFENHKLFLIRYTDDMELIMVDDKGRNQAGYPY